DKLAASTMGKMRGLLRSPQPREDLTTRVQVKGFGDVYTRELGFIPFPLRPGFSGDLDAKRSGYSFHHGHEKRRQIIAAPEVVTLKPLHRVAGNLDMRASVGGMRCRSHLQARRVG